MLTLRLALVSEAALCAASLLRVYDDLMPPALLEAADSQFEALVAQKMKAKAAEQHSPPGFLPIDDHLFPSADDLISSLTYWVVTAIPEVASLRSFRGRNTLVHTAHG
uniref:Uncharacterized protein n=1 Tax=Calcidiscus leptoporus TaxID=127549 RepID=A0A7S0IZ06_9EUKA|mmetsp:Transcript_30688/g.71380  ORF Transcript_30688/g.71380 Transcript_30688/m.71380 type:complete len:108 (+) Transcript_30688:47-370(+)